MLQRCGAFRAFNGAVVFGPGKLPIAQLHHTLQHAADGVGTGEHLKAVLPQRGMAADATQLFDDALHINAGAQRRGNQPAGGF